MKKFSLMLSLLLVSLLGKTQSREISGTISAFNKFPLNNVKVIAKKSKDEAITDVKGYFKIAVKKNDVLIIETKTFESYRHPVKGSVNSVKINLIYRDRQRNKEIATEAGYIKRDDLEFGIENLVAENNAFSNFTNVYDAIKYALPATTIITENGEKKIQIRGPKTILGSNAALTIVDGVIIEDISFIIPSDIISIKQLSSASTSLYGARGGNGVIVITTK